MGTGEPLSHFDQAGNARMVSVGTKPETVRTARAEGLISMSGQAFARVKEGSVAKGDVLGVARLAGIMAAKKTDQLIPLCHPLNITGADVGFQFNNNDTSIKIEATVSITGKTGVEMEALCAVTVAALTIYDMCKAIDKGMEIKDIHLVFKSGGKSGDYVREAERSEKEDLL